MAQEWLSADGIGYSGTRFVENFKDFIDEFKFLDMLQASVYHFDDIQNYWAFHSRFMKLNYFDQPASESFLKLKEYLKGKSYHIITTNSDNSLEARLILMLKRFFIFKVNTTCFNVQGCVIIRFIQMIKLFMKWLRSKKIWKFL
nr:hypothetical protein [Mycoplasmopsis bovis]